MKILKYCSLLILPVLIISVITFAQGSGEPFFPETANGAKYIHSTGHRLLWENPDSTIFNIVFFSEDSNLVAQFNNSTLLYDGTPSTVYDTIYLTPVEPLDWDKKYYWRVVEYYSSEVVEGPVWSFRTMYDPDCYYDEFFDDFNSGLSNWTITNDGGTCIWEIHDAYEYTLPNTASGNVMAADADFCGSGTSTLTTITLNTTIHGGWYPVFIEFDNDWHAIDAEDEAYVEVSNDSGNTWNIVWSQIGVSVRNTHEYITTNISGELFIRFRSVQPGWDWWWAIDNVHTGQLCPLTIFYPPHNLLLNTVPSPNLKVELTWSIGLYSDACAIDRKTGLPTDTTEYSIIGIVNPTITSFIDTTVESDQTYTYRVWYLGAGISNEATTYIYSIVPVELTSFTASVNDNDVRLNWATATELNNSGFEVQRFNPLPGREQKEWVIVGFISGHGTTTEQHYYSFTDESVASGKYQYRLKQIDYDGTFEYSDIIEVEVELPLKFSLEQNYPNPFNPSTTIKFTIPTSPQSPPYQGGEAKQGWFVQLKVYDVLGNEIATLVNEEKPAGKSEVEFGPASGIRNPASGIYFYQLKAGDLIQTKKMILLK